MTQAEALSILTTGVSAFITGEPGSGKTHTVAAYIAWLRERGVEPAITASTGIAATHLHGMTVHAWSGIGIAEYATEQVIDAIAAKEHVARRIQKTVVLIIDEISMLSGSTFELVDKVCRAVRRSERPFGGMQVVVVGDFFQLPPVGKRGGSTPQFAFASTAWRDLNPIVCYLEEQHRQEDPAFLDVLAAIRRAEADHLTASALMAREADPYELPEDVPLLHTHNADVDRVNEQKLIALTGASKVFTMESRGAAPLVEALKRGCLSPERLVLKQGAVVMGTKNIPAIGMANGTLGEVVAFAKDGMPIIETRDGRTITVPLAEWVVEEAGKVRAAISQVPLRLAWAITVHKSQGMSMDAAAIDLSRAFEYGQGYVSLSRVRSLDGLHLTGWSEDALRMHPEVLRADADFRARSEEARKAFAALDAAGEREDMEHAFLTAAGGTLTPSVTAENSAARSSSSKISSHHVTLTFMQQSMPLTEIATTRGVTVGTIVGHVEKLLTEGTATADGVRTLLPEKLAQELDAIASTCGNCAALTLTEMRDATNGKFTFDELRMARLVLSGTE